MARSKPKADLQTMNAMAGLYGGKVTPASALRVILLYEIGIVAFAALMYTPKKFIVIGIVAIIGGMFVYHNILPYNVQDAYRQSGERERNQFIHLVTQGMSSDEADMLLVTKNAVNSAHGEFYQDMMQLVISMQLHRDYQGCHPAFQKITDKYQDDIAFGMFMEQIETTFYESEYDIRTFRSFQNFHDTMINKEKEFFKRKQSWRSGLVMVIACAWGTCAIIMLSQGYKAYLLNWNTLFGFCVATLFFILMAIELRRDFKNFYDNNVLEE